MKEQFKEFEIPFGAKDSELCGWEYTIPEGMEATIVDNKIVVKKKESEDEQHRKWILEYLYDGLRKSDEQFFDQFKSAIAWFEKQGEQKPTDKVEPKFKVGDWVVVNDGRIGRIIDYTKDFAYVDLEFSRLSTRINNIRFWTIQDVKDGDVLVTKNKNIFIFKSISGYTIYDYCGLYFEKFADSSGTVNGTAAIQLPTDYVPATTEQRDLLFQKMHEAGYEWDADKKELKKIKNNK